ncbi:phosphatase PAP2 family protein [Pelagibacterium halotolerans]|uniref:PA-phosphatase related phosphoesterase n=1 Tax=Pelagibacterium halotolerans (strain DSM 22347 / JCM 15775 / CGMCC 1.7692 / B2) TaxID=1082931 RepID=G4RF86_PELHB|nr:phosphatase PAP2 family protein [Pelagibacterium halotolerans]AEQ50954.1 PA-phosphatase related phosphoesterase [Pelagibacterium halotolerans B2]QJR19150.1 phosphatase PAP2 family protein [Pelagibacterium halotolerans]SEA00893.1 undecaprenyl-diphosphatase [Pelagibacterium halotolerans]
MLPELFKRTFSSSRFRRLRDFVLAEQAVLLAIGISAALVFAFLEIADEVSEGETHEIDIAILEMFRVPGDPDQMLGSFWFQEAVRDITALGSFSVLTLVVSSVVIYLLLTRRVAAASFVAGAVISGALLSDLLKEFFDRPRPEFSAVAGELSASFPSGHSMISAVTYLTLGALLARLSERRREKVFFYGVAIVLTALVGSSRVLLGVHYPSDVIGGWALGAAWAFAATALATMLRRRGMV